MGTDQVTEARAALDALATVDLDACDRAALDAVLARWRTVRSFVDAVEVRIARRSRKLAAEGRSECPEAVLADHGRRSSREARSAAERERACAQLPCFEPALAAGTVSAGHVDALAAATHGLDDTAHDAFVAHAPSLLELASQHSVEVFARECRDLARAVTADEGESRLAQQKTQCRARRWIDRITGMHHIHAELDPETGTKAWGAILAHVTTLRHQARHADTTTTAGTTTDDQPSRDRDSTTTTAAADVTVENDSGDTPATAHADAESGAGTRADAESGAGTRADAESGAGTRADAESGAGTRADADAESGAGTRADAESGAGTRADAESGAGTRADAESGAGTRADADAESGAGTRAAGGNAAGRGERGGVVNWERLAAQALVELVTGARSVDRRVPEVSVLIDLDTLIGGLHDTSVCETVDGTLLPPSTIRRMCCSADILPVVLNGDGEVLDVGRTERLATRAQRRALQAMYRTCGGHPGCQVPFDRCEIHHVVPWDPAGLTDLDNLIPLCPVCHHLVHEGHWTLTLDRHRAVTLIRPDGIVHFHGTTIDRTTTTASATGRSGRPERPPGTRRTAA